MSFFFHNTPHHTREQIFVCMYIHTYVCRYTCMSSRLHMYACERAVSVAQHTINSLEAVFAVSGAFGRLGD